jgi:hypothetical protein
MVAGRFYFIPPRAPRAAPSWVAVSVAMSRTSPRIILVAERLSGLSSSRGWS